MSIIIGFGKAEIDVANKIIDECISALEKIDLTQIKITDEISRIRLKYKELGNRYDKMDRNDAPERYTTFRYTLPHDFVCEKYRITFCMWHINRRHAFSKDGWALWRTKWTLQINGDKENNTLTFIKFKED